MAVHLAGINHSYVHKGRQSFYAPIHNTSSTVRSKNVKNGMYLLSSGSSPATTYLSQYTNGVPDNVCVCIQSHWSGPYPEEPEDEVLLFTSDCTVSIGRDGIAKQPESQCTSKYVNVFLNGKIYMHVYSICMKQTM